MFLFVSAIMLYVNFYPTNVNIFLLTLFLFKLCTIFHYNRCRKHVTIDMDTKQVLVSIPPITTSFPATASITEVQVQGDPNLIMEF